MAAAGRARPDSVILRLAPCPPAQGHRPGVGVYKAEGLGVTIVAWLAMMLLLYPCVAGTSASS